MTDVDSRIMKKFNRYKKKNTMFQAFDIAWDAGSIVDSTLLLEITKSYASLAA